VLALYVQNHAPQVTQTTDSAIRDEKKMLKEAKSRTDFCNISLHDAAWTEISKKSFCLKSVTQTTCVLGQTINIYSHS